MAKFPSTLLPASSDLTETRKAILDLLDKINRLATSIPGVSSAGMKTVSANYTFTPTDGVTDLFVTTGASTVTVTLGRSVDNPGRFVRIWKADSGAGEVKITGATTGATTETVDGYAAVYAGFQYQHADIYQDGTTNFNVGQYIQPVAGEPSLGTDHYHPSQYAAEVYTNTSPTALTFYTVTVSGLPAGTKKINITGWALGATPSGEVLWRPYGCTDTFVQSYHRTLGMIPFANSYVKLHGEVTVDSSGRFQVAAGLADIDIHIRGYNLYGI